jgi:hypothetical protein
MTWRISGYRVTGRIVGRSHELDVNGRRRYLFLSMAGNLFCVSGDMLREDIS